MERRGRGEHKEKEEEKKEHKVCEGRLDGDGDVLRSERRRRNGCMRGAEDSGWAAQSGRHL
jgi:hypothetical protein